MKLRYVLTIVVVVCVAAGALIQFFDLYDLTSFGGDFINVIKGMVLKAVDTVKNLYMQNPLQVIVGALTAGTTVFGIANHFYQKSKEESTEQIRDVSNQLEGVRNQKDQFQTLATKLNEDLKEEAKKAPALEAQITSLNKELEETKDLKHQLEQQVNDLKREIEDLKNIKITPYAK